MSAKDWKSEINWTNGDVLRQAEKDESYISMVEEARIKTKHQKYLRIWKCQILLKTV